MKKNLLLLLLSYFFIEYAAAQPGTPFYYYNGKKIYVSETYSRLVVGLKNPGIQKGRLLVAEEFGIPVDSVKPAANKGEFLVQPGSLLSKITSKGTLAAISKKGVIAFARPVLIGATGKLATYSSEFVVALKQGTTVEQMQALVVRHHCLFVKKYPFAPGIYILSAGEANDFDALKMANLFFESGMFKYAEPDFRTLEPFASVPNDPLYPLQWAHKNTCMIEQVDCTKHSDMKVDSAWQVTMGSSEIKIAVMDTGVDTGHADLKANLLQGFDCLTLTANPGDGRPKDLAGSHGTACAGIVAAVANNGIGVAGIAPKCKIIPINMTDENGTFASEVSVAAGLDYAWQNGAAVITNSWTLGLQTGAVDAAIERAVTQGRNGKGALLLFATGNKNSGLDYPSTLPLVIAVGGINMCSQRKSPYSCDGQYNWGANHGVGLDVVAPCVRIATTDISGEAGYNTAIGVDGDYYQEFAGTSSACPNAAGVMALILSANPALTAAQARAVMETGCDKIPEYNFTMTPGNPAGTWNSELGYGRVNAYKSVLAAKSGNYCTVDIAVAGKTILCKNDKVKIQVVNPQPSVNYIWRTNGIINDSSRPVLTVSAAGTYDLTATYPNGCTAVSTPETITAPVAEILQADAGKPVSICPGAEPVRLGGMPSAKGGVRFMGNKRGYGIDLLRSGLIKFNTENPQQYSLGNITYAPEITSKGFFTGDFTPLGYYVLSRAGDLVRMDTITGYQTLIAKLAPKPGLRINGLSWTGLAWDPSGKELYAVTSGEQPNYLYKVDLVTGATVAGAYLRDSRIQWLAFNPFGTLFCFTTTYNKIIRIDKNTGVTYGDYSEDVGRDAITWLDGGFDPTNGKLYFSTYFIGAQTLAEDLREMDTLTGKITVKGVIGPLAEVGATAITGGNYDYTWSPSNWLLSNKDANPLAKPSETTTYTLTVKDFCGAVAVSKVTVTANTGKPPVKISAAKDSICIGDSLKLSATRNDNYHYQWFVNGKIIPGEKDSIYTAARMGKYQVRVTNGRGGCENISSVFTVRDCSIKLNNNNSDTTCYSYFYASGGYADTSFRQNERWVKTIYPAGPGSKLKISFSNFQINAYYGYYFDTNDTLFVYGGPDVNAPLIGAFSADKWPRLNYDYHSSLGPLTFKFRSGPYDDNVGSWDAFISCFKSKVFRSRVSGKFNRASTWEVKDEDGRFIQAQSFPEYYEDSIIIRPGHTVTVDTFSLKVDQLWVQKGATLVCANGLELMDTAGFDLIADGDIHLISYGSLLGKGQLLLNGNLEAGYNTVQVPCYINGTAPQLISVSSRALFDSLYLQNKATVTIKGPITAQNMVMNSAGRLVADAELYPMTSLHLLNGIIDVNGNNFINTWRDIKLTGGNAGSFINGKLRLFPREDTVMQRLIFPVGYGSIYKPLVLDKKSRSIFYDQHYTVDFKVQQPPAATLPAGIDKLVNTGYWHVEVFKTDTVTAHAVTLAYTQEDGVKDPALLRIVKTDGKGNWINLGGIGSHADTGTITSAINFTGAGDFALAYATGTLPVTWISFTASPYGKQVKLKWDVAKEINIAHYTVEHSVDGDNFKAIAQLPVQTGGANKKSYQWLHSSPISGINFYRIKQVDKDGRFSLSKIQSVSFKNHFEYTVTPNPASDEVLISSDEMIKEIAVYDMHGRLLKKVMPASTQYKLKVIQLPAAVYNLRIVTTSGTFNAKLVKREL